MEEKLELKPAENTAYWWTNRLKYIARNIAKNYEREKMYPMSPNQKRFIKIFYGFSEKDWRNLYLNLDDNILQNIKNDIDNLVQNEKFSPTRKHTLPEVCPGV